ncbi:MAG: peptide-methionine (S)-S-oxide reductase MsrA [Myxococcota bacterium]|nr:peptide-methionine (S)-S-oxide reductase MsrA [Myxococcota bacterium]
MFGPDKTQMPSPDEALAGRDTPVPVPDNHFVNQNPMQGPFEDKELALFGMGCFWGAEKKFWQTDRIYSTAVGYSAGYTKNPTYREVCSGETGHNEVVRVVFDPTEISYEAILKLFWENHDPTQGMRQGNDIGTQYRSGIYYYSQAQKELANTSRQAYQSKIMRAGYGEISTEIIAATNFYFAEDYHQQYLAKNPDGYCGLGGTGIRYPVGIKA